MKKLFFIILLLSVLYVNCNEVCKLNVDVGLCKAAFPRFFFNTVTNQCEEFTWGGCGGNENNFDSLESCRGTCQN